MSDDETSGQPPKYKLGDVKLAIDMSARLYEMFRADMGSGVIRAIRRRDDLIIPATDEAESYRRGFAAGMEAGLECVPSDINSINLDQLMKLWTEGMNKQQKS